MCESFEDSFATLDTAAPIDHELATSAEHERSDMTWIANLAAMQAVEHQQHRILCEIRSRMHIAQVLERIQSRARRKQPVKRFLSGSIPTRCSVNDAPSQAGFIVAAGEGGGRHPHSIENRLHARKCNDGSPRYTSSHSFDEEPP